MKKKKTLSAADRQLVLDSYARSEEMAANPTRFQEAEYRETGNPLEPWRALWRTHLLARPIPDWVLAYLVQCAEKLEEAQDDCADIEGMCEAEHVGRVLGFGGDRGRRGAFPRLRQRSRDSDLACWAAREMYAGTKRDAAYALVAEQFHVNERTVRRAFMKHAPELFPDLLAKRKSE